MARYNFDNAVDYAAALLNKETGEEEGAITGYYTKSGAFYAHIRLYTGNLFNGEYAYGSGRACGYGYEKISTAIESALHDADIATRDKEDPQLANSAAHFTGHKYTDEQVSAICKAKKIIPVYGGTGNHERAFGIFWNVITVKC